MKRIVRDTALAALIGLIPACSPSPSEGPGGSGGTAVPGSGGKVGTGMGGKAVMPGAGGSDPGGGGAMANGGAAGGQGGAKPSDAGSAVLPKTDMGSGGAAVMPGLCAATGSYFPLAVGNKWTYKVTDGTVITVKTQTVMGMEAVGGTGPSKAVMAFKLETAKVAGMAAADKTISWQAVDGTKVVRYREVSYQAGVGGMPDVEDHWVPSRLRIDNAFVGTRNEMYTEFKKQLLPPLSSSECTHTETWTVVGTNLTETVAGKSYSNVLKIRKKGLMPMCKPPTLAQAPSLEKEYLFARCVGKIKESSVVVGNSPTEELTDVMLK